MKRSLRLILTGLLLIGALGVPAGAFDLAAEQSVKGTIAAPIPSNVSGGPRRAFLVSRATNGVIGHAFDVDAATIGGSFDLTKTGDPTGQGDLNLIFYSDPGTLADAPAIVGEFSSAAVGGERGIVPDEAKIAMVFISGGAGVSFDYKATPPPVVSLAEGATLDVTSRTGGVVRFVNNTATTAFVRHVPAAGGAAAFTSDPAGIEPGATFDVLLPGAGTYAYESSVGSGTITVAD